MVMCNSFRIFHPDSEYITHMRMLKRRVYIYKKEVMATLPNETILFKNPETNTMQPEQTTQPEYDAKAFNQYTTGLGSPLPVDVQPVDDITAPISMFKKRKADEIETVQDTIAPFEAANKKIQDHLDGMDVFRRFEKTSFEVWRVDARSESFMAPFKTKKAAMKYINEHIAKDHLIMIKSTRKVVPMFHRAPRVVQPKKKKVKRTPKSGLLNMYDFFSNAYGPGFGGHTCNMLCGGKYEPFGDWSRQKGKRNIWFIPTGLTMDDRATSKQIRQTASRAKSIPVATLQQEIMNKFSPNDKSQPMEEVIKQMTVFIERTIRAYPSYYDPTNKKETFKLNVFCSRLRKLCYKNAKESMKMLMEDINGGYVKDKDLPKIKLAD